MARRHQTLTLTFTLDEDICRDADSDTDYDGTTVYTRTLDQLRTDIQRTANTILAPLDPHLDSPVVAFHGHTYEPEPTITPFFDS